MHTNQQTPTAALLSRKMIRMADVLKIVPATRQTLYRWIENGRFPKPVKLGDSVIGFCEAEVIAWLDARPRAGQKNETPMSDEH
ncbi:MAG: AlpA family phage regulatory protein [Hyphomicrobium sp.]|uniref:helix-turn-helix transcriptional regulator n=1 Tax=Hyphomicrobium sp. TaxID=82 RepID=UPI0035651B4B